MYRAIHTAPGRFCLRFLKQLKIVSEALHVHADSVHEKFTVASRAACFNRASVCYTAGQDHCIKEILNPSIVKIDISKFISFGSPVGDSVQEQTSHYRSLERHLTGDR